MRELPSLDPNEIGLPDTPRVRRILSVFEDSNTRHAEVFNENGELTQMLLDLATRFGLDLREIDLSKVNSPEDTYELLGLTPAGVQPKSWQFEERKPGYILTRFDPFVLNHSERFTPYRDLDNAVQPLMMSAQYGGMVKRNDKNWNAFSCVVAFDDIFWDKTRAALYTNYHLVSPQ